MKAQLIRVHNGRYISDLPDFDIRDNTVTVSIELDADQLMQRSYKKLKSVAMLERYQQKSTHENTTPIEIDSKEEFRSKFGLENVNSLADLLARL